MHELVQVQLLTRRFEASEDAVRAERARCERALREQSEQFQEALAQQQQLHRREMAAALSSQTEAARLTQLLVARDGKAAGYSCAEAKAAGYNARECMQAGFSFQEGKAAGYREFNLQACTESNWNSGRYDWNGYPL